MAPLKSGAMGGICCCSCCLTVGIVMFVVGLVERIRLDKLFEIINCDDVELGGPPQSFEMYSLGPGNHTAEERMMAFQMSNVSVYKWKSRMCENPNAMAFTSRTHTNGTVYYLEEDGNGEQTFTPIGEAWSDETTLPIEGAALQTQHTFLRINLVLAAKMAGNPPSKLVYMWPVESSAELTIFGAKIKNVKRSEIFCGQLVDYNTSETGPIICGGDDRSSVDFKPIGWVDESLPPGRSQIVVPEEDAKAGKQRRNRLLFGVMLLGVIFAFSGSFVLHKIARSAGYPCCRCLRRGQTSAPPSEQQEDKTAASDVVTAPLRDDNAAPHTTSADVEQGNGGNNGQVQPSDVLRWPDSKDKRKEKSATPVAPAPFSAKAGEPAQNLDAREYKSEESFN